MIRIYFLCYVLFLVAIPRLASSNPGICAKYSELLAAGELAKQGDDYFCGPFCIANVVTAIKHYRGDTSQIANQNFASVRNLLRQIRQKGTDFKEGMWGHEMARVLRNEFKRSNVKATVASRKSNFEIFPPKTVRRKDLIPLNTENKIQIGLGEGHWFVILGFDEDYIHYVGPEDSIPQRAKVYDDDLGLKFTYMNSDGVSEIVPLHAVYTITISNQN